MRRPWDQGGAAVLQDSVLHHLLQVSAQAHSFLQNSSMGKLHLFTSEPMGQHFNLEVPEEPLKTPSQLLRR